MENTPENCYLWEEQGLRLSEAKAVIKDNAHEAGWIKEETQKHGRLFYTSFHNLHETLERYRGQKEYSNSTFPLV